MTVAVVAGAVWALAAAGASWADARIGRPDRTIRARERREKWILSR